MSVVQDLAKAYKRRHPGTAIDLEWDTTMRAVHLVKAEEAQIAWDGIAAVANIANPIRAMSGAQVRKLFPNRLQTGLNWMAPQPEWR